MASGVRNGVFGQFGNPTGFWGAMAGRVMARRPSNRRRNAWTVELLRLRPGERVLEIGFGPGLALTHAAAAVGPRGFVVGIDHSPVMLAQATRRNRAAIAAGRMDLRVAAVDALPDLAPFDAILAVNTVFFWRDQRARVRELLGRLNPGGRLAITVQPRSKGATADTSRRIGEDLRRLLGEAGFAAVAVHTLPLDPPAVCAIGNRPVE